MKAEKSQTIFIHWLNVALKEPRWRVFIRARLRESELPVIDLGTAGDTWAAVTQNDAVESVRSPERVIVVR